MPLYEIILRSGDKTERVRVHADNRAEATRDLRRRMEWWRTHGTPQQKNASIESVNEINVNQQGG